MRVVPGQMKLDSYVDMGVLVALDLVNRTSLATPLNPATTVNAPLLRDVLAADPASAHAVSRRHVPAFAALAESLHGVLEALVAGDDDRAAPALNALFRRSPAHPHLAKEDGRWRLHHHPPEAELVPMWTSICAESISRLLSAGHIDRFHACADPRCARFYFDATRPGTRRSCSTTCQNRIKAATLRSGRRQAK